MVKGHSFLNHHFFGVEVGEIPWCSICGGFPDSTQLPFVVRFILKFFMTQMRTENSNGPLFVAFNSSSPWLVYVHHCHFSLSRLSPQGATWRWCSCAEMVSTCFNPSRSLKGHRGQRAAVTWTHQPRFRVDILTLGAPPVLGRTMAVDHTIGDVSDPFLSFCFKGTLWGTFKHLYSWATYYKWWLHVTTTTWKLHKVNYNLQHPTIIPG